MIADLLEATPRLTALRCVNNVFTANAQPSDAGDGDVALVVQPAAPVLAHTQYPDAVRIVIDEEVYRDEGAVGIHQIQ